MSDTRADRIRHWLAVADDEDSQEKELAARYAAAAAARLWVLHKLDAESDDPPDTWDQVRKLADEADNYLDDDRQDEALYRRAQANLLALKLFEDSDEPQRPSGGGGQEKAADSTEAKDTDEDSDGDTIEKADEAEKAGSTAG
ncbi:hypothetical protein BH09ACT7_BH09ACT7_40320 [soil metagenome]